MRETGRGGYFSEIKRKIVDRFPGSVVLRLDPESNFQGIPDILVLYKSRWAMLEIKSSYKSSVRPNQQYYVDLFNSMSYASFIFPENEEEILDDLERTFGFSR